MLRSALTLATLMTVALAALAPSRVAAGQPVIATPMLTAASTGDGQRLECRVINVSKKPVTVTTELIKSDGTVASGGGGCEIAPGREGCLASGICSATIFVCRAYCRFTGASAKKIRGSILLKPASTGETLVALPAE